MMAKRSSTGKEQERGTVVHPRDVVLVLGSGATFGGGFLTHVDASSVPVPMDHNFWASAAVRELFVAERYPALRYYREQVGGDGELGADGEQLRANSLEGTWAYIDMLAKFCISNVVTEEDAWERLRDDLERRAGDDRAYRNKLQIERVGTRVPALAV